MKLYELSEQEFRSFLDAHPLKSFLQTPEIAKLREQFGWESYYVGLKKENQVIAASMIISTGNFLGKKIFYAPRGILIDFENQELLKIFFMELKTFVKNHQGYVFKMDPYWESVERDLDGNVVKTGFNHLSTITTLKEIGFIQIPSEQTKWMFVLDINGKTFDELKKDFRASTKNVLNKVLKSDIKVRELEYNDLPTFKNLTEETSERKNFEDKPLCYYQKMFQLFKPLGQIKFLIAELSLSDYINSLTEEQNIILNKLEKSKYERTNEKRKVEYEMSLKRIDKKLKEAFEIQEEVGNTLILSGGMFILYGNEVVYLYSGNYKKYMNFNAQYKIQYEMINYATTNKYKRYNFYGITEFKDKTHKDYGVYDFKRGFNGKVIELIGGFELPITKHYYLHKLLSSLKNFRKGAR